MHCFIYRHGNEKYQSVAVFWDTEQNINARTRSGLEVRVANKNQRHVDNSCNLEREKSKLLHSYMCMHTGVFGVVLVTVKSRRAKVYVV